MGNIEFEDDPDDNRGGCRVTDASEKSLQITGELLGLDPGNVRFRYDYYLKQMKQTN